MSLNKKKKTRTRFKTESARASISEFFICNFVIPVIMVTIPI